MHMQCMDEMLKHKQFACPICSKTMVEMSHIWRILDREVMILSMISYMPIVYLHAFHNYFRFIVSFCMLLFFY